VPGAVWRGGRVAEGA